MEESMNKPNVGENKIDILKDWDHKDYTDKLCEKVLSDYEERIDKTIPFIIKKDQKHLQIINEYKLNFSNEAFSILFGKPSELLFLNLNDLFEGFLQTINKKLGISPYNLKYEAQKHGFKIKFVNADDEKKYISIVGLLIIERISLIRSEQVNSEGDNKIKIIPVINHSEEEQSFIYLCQDSKEITYNYLEIERDLPIGNLIKISWPLYQEFIEDDDLTLKSKKDSKWSKIHFMFIYDSRKEDLQIQYMGQRYVNFNQRKRKGDPAVKLAQEMLDLQNGDIVEILNPVLDKSEAVTVSIKVLLFKD